MKKQAAGEVLHGGQHRWANLGHFVVRIALMVLVFFQLNYLGCRRYNTIDFSRSQRFTISDRTRGFLEELGSNVRIVTAFLATSDLLPDVKGLVSEYDRIGGDRITTEMLDLSRSRDRITELRDKHKLALSRDQVLIISESGRIRMIGAEELVVRDPETGRITQFRGEEKLTAALLEVTEQQQKKVYLVTGDRRADQLVPIAQQLAEMTNAQNARLESLILKGRQSIPEDADALIFPGNTTDLTRQEAEMVTSFWEEQRGGLLIFLDPAADTPNLESILRENGVFPRGDRILTVRSIPGLGYSKIYHTPVTLMPGFGPTRDLPILALQLLDRTESLRVMNEDDLYLSQNIRPQPLMLANQSYWGETDHGAAMVSYDPDVDNGRPNPVYAAAAIEKGCPRRSAIGTGSVAPRRGWQSQLDCGGRQHPEDGRGFYDGLAQLGHEPGSASRDLPAKAGQLQPVCSGRFLRPAPDLVDLGVSLVVAVLRCIDLVSSEGLGATTCFWHSTAISVRFTILISCPIAGRSTPSISGRSLTSRCRKQQGGSKRIFRRQAHFAAC